MRGQKGFPKKLYIQRQVFKDSGEVFCAERAAKNHLAIAGESEVVGVYTLDRMVKVSTKVVIEDV